MSGQQSQLSVQQQDQLDKKNEKTRKIVWFFLIAITIIWLILGLWNFSKDTGNEIAVGVSSVYDMIADSC